MRLTTLRTTNERYREMSNQIIDIQYIPGNPIQVQTTIWTFGITA